ncbi:MAG: type II toxin-antitoxin system VapC family toxin [Alphaproteobacteria bacterium]|nr:type II toxin-antitoxin system VapC family toxin [Alphaproteobacteria bacterium]MBM3642052.1 type II toxin-antitoxin system VapC family toxin [Alphaproteobacteria bacterium]
MKITADTNVLVRAAVMDDPVQGAVAVKALLDAELVAVPLPSLCEFVWVLTRGYKKNASEVADALRRLIESASVVVDRPAVEAGLAVFEKGGDFADGVIAFEGRGAGGRVFASFDKEAVELISATGGEAKLLGRK